MAFNVTQLDDLDRAMATGAREIRYEDRVYVMRSVADMLKIRRMIKESLGLLPKGPKRVRYSQTKGLDS